MADWIVGGIVLVVVLLALRSVWKQHRNGHCNGNCAGCQGCSRGIGQNQEQSNRAEE